MSNRKPNELRSPAATRRAIGGAVALTVVAAVVIVGPLFIDADPLRTGAGPPSRPPGTEGHLLGTDSLGRDVLVRILVGGRISLVVGLAVAAVALFVGIAVGAAAAAGPRWFDTASMRLIDALTTVPFLVLVLALRAVLAPGVTSTVLVLSAFTWFAIARVVRAQVMTLRARTFVDAAVVAGERRLTIIVRHLVPNALPPVLAVTSLVTAEAIIAETTLSWLNLGVPVTTPTWGNILVDAQREALLGNWWSLAAPAVGIGITIAAVGAIAAALKDRP